MGDKISNFAAKIVVYAFTIAIPFVFAEMILLSSVGMTPTSLADDNGNLNNAGYTFAFFQLLLFAVAMVFGGWIERIQNDK